MCATFNAYILPKQHTWNVNRAKIRKWFHIKKSQDADYVDDLVLLTDSPAQAESLLHNPE